ncbi:NAD-dependent epimerase/dehydratase family protein [Paenibacillus tuaregi]|uniref:NAD-dependent epimerase/dehydratase family protein n=1 Tax=Paenibacillus tuaregi TaxID=1816681 RepID=UPI00083981E0|nr:NAD-dependent epimerase/dehydratase family protein [Paenibacillus tuaregi]
MRKILIFGGTRYFGKKLVELLLQEGEHDVTIATRGNSPVIFSKRIKHLTLDRTNRADLLALTSQGDWDLVYDNICYSSDDAQIAVDAFEGRVGQYIMTSTLSVYEPVGRAVIEDDFNPYIYPIKKGASSDFTYSEGKRQAEAVLFQKAHFPVQAMRIPIVLGTDDYTKRLHFHVHRIQKGTSIGVPNLDARLSFISSNEAAEFLAWLGQGLVKGPVNAASEGSISVRQIVRTIEEATGRTAIIKGETGPENQSPFGVPADWLMDTSKAVRAGYRFTPLASWFPKLVQAITDGRA